MYVHVYESCNHDETQIKDEIQFDLRNLPLRLIEEEVSRYMHNTTFNDQIYEAR